MILHLQVTEEAIEAASEAVDQHLQVSEEAPGVFS
jgi:hypothetical protein